MTEDRDKAIVDPGQGMFRVKASERVLFLPAGPMARLLAARFFAKKARTRPYPARVFRLKRQGREIDLAGPCMGAPVAAMVLEQLIAGGAKKIIVLGFAGSLDPGLKISDLLLVSEALCDEGTSKDYFPESNPPVASESLTAALKLQLESKSRPFKTGKVFSTDGFFRETLGKIADFRSRGALAVEMELSALYTIGRYRGVELAGMAAISDEHSDQGWKSGFKSPSLLLQFLHGAEAALDVLSR